MEIARAAPGAVAGASASNAIPWPPVPPTASVIDLPADQYLHRGAPTEWWWHIGTLTAGERVFGFEINAVSFVGLGGIGFSQIMLTDVANKAHYQRTAPYLPPLLFNGDHWAEHDPTRDWYVRLGDAANGLSTIDVTNPGSGYTADPNVLIRGGGGALAYAVPVRKDDKVASILLLSPGLGFKSPPEVTITGGGGSGATAKAVHTYVAMAAPWSQSMSNMAVKALLNDEATGTEVAFDLRMSQVGPPFMVWGTGVQPVPGKTGGHLETNNYYYSLTRLQTQGTIAFGGETFAVTGNTWMDHEYGAFGSAEATPKWILQDMQLDNGVHVSNYTLVSTLPAPGVPIPSHATVQRANGTTYFVPSTIAPSEPWTSPVTGKTYYLTLDVEIPVFAAKLRVTSLVAGQEFPVPGAPIYEGVAKAEGRFEGAAVSGPAWNEQTATRTP
jgi:predicted secreted hydrolase